MKLHRFNTLFEAVKTPKKYGFTYTQRDWKESFREIKPWALKLVKNHPGFAYFDVETGWNDAIYTVGTNYDNIEKLVKELEEDIFIGQEGVADKEGILWFDSPAELKSLINKGMEIFNKELEDEDEESDAKYNAVKKELAGMKKGDKVVYLDDEKQKKGEVEKLVNDKKHKGIVWVYFKGNQSGYNLGAIVSVNGTKVKAKY